MSESQGLRWAPVGDDDGECAVFLTPGWHRCNPDPSVNYGIGCAHLYFAFRKRANAIVFYVFTDWGLPDDEFNSAVDNCRHPSHQSGYPTAGAPRAGSVNLHMSQEHRSALGKDETHCDYTGADQCWGDVGYSLGDTAFNVLLTEGTNGLWKWLETFLDEYLADR